LHSECGLSVAFGKDDLSQPNRGRTVLDKKVKEIIEKMMHCLSPSFILNKMKTKVFVLLFF